MALTSEQRDRLIQLAGKAAIASYSDQPYLAMLRYLDTLQKEFEAALWVADDSDQDFELADSYLHGFNELYMRCEDFNAYTTAQAWLESVKSFEWSRVGLIEQLALFS